MPTPGPARISIERAELDGLGADGRKRLGDPLDTPTEDGKVQLETRPETRPVPLGGVFLLGRTSSGGVAVKRDPEEPNAGAPRRRLPRLPHASAPARPSPRGLRPNRGGRAHVLRPDRRRRPPARSRRPSRASSSRSVHGHEPASVARLGREDLAHGRDPGHVRRRSGSRCASRTFAGCSSASEVTRPTASDLQVALYLAHAVGRVLAPIPRRSRCLVQSLVLTKMLARRGISSSLVIAVAPGPQLEAHAWVESGQIPLLAACHSRAGPACPTVTRFALFPSLRALPPLSKVPSAGSYVHFVTREGGNGRPSRASRSTRPRS